MSVNTKYNNKGSLTETSQLAQNNQIQGFNTSSLKWNDPSYLARTQAVSQIRESYKLDIQTASNVTPTPKTWLYPNLLLEGELTVLAGSPGDGKTTFARTLAAGITIGKSYTLYPGLNPVKAGHVIIVNREDDRARGLYARLQAADANLDKIHFIGGNITQGDDSPFSFSKERDISRLVGIAAILENNVSLIIIDPVYFAVDGDQNSDHKARIACEQLAVLAKRLKCAILGIAHTARITQGKSGLGRIAGPPALRQVPRQILLLSKIFNGPTEAGGTHVLVQVKNSEGNSDGGFEYQIVPVEIPSQDGAYEAPKFVVTQKLSGSPEHILGKADFGAKSEKMSKSDCAEKFLQTVLKDGPRLWIDIESLAKDSDVKKGTLMKAKTSLKIVVKKITGNQGRSQWSLPADIDTNSLTD